MTWDNDRMNILGNGLTVLGDAVLVFAALDARKEEDQKRPEIKTLDADSLDLLGSCVVLIADALLAIATIITVEANRRGVKPPDTEGIETLGNWGSFLGDALAIMAAEMASA